MLAFCHYFVTRRPRRARAIALALVAATTAAAALAQPGGGPSNASPTATAASEPPAAPFANDAYTARVAAPDASAAARGKLLAQALKDVLQRVVGRSDPAFASILPRAETLVQTFGYERDAATGELQLVARFDPRGVDDAVRAQRLPVFGVYPSAVEPVALTVDGVRSPADYSRVLTSLRGAAGVRSVALTAADGESMQFQLSVEGGQERLASALGGRLQPDASGHLHLLN